jgi:hypothetical protein
MAIQEHGILIVRNALRQQRGDHAEVGAPKVAELHGRIQTRANQMVAVAYGLGSSLRVSNWAQDEVDQAVKEYVPEQYGREGEVYNLDVLDPGGAQTAVEMYELDKVTAVIEAAADIAVRSALSGVPDVEGRPMLMIVEAA